MKKTGLICMVMVAIIVLSIPFGISGCAGGPDGEAEEVVLRVGSTRPFSTTNKFSDYWYGVLSGITTHDSLIKLGPDMQPVPWLAREWHISEDSKTFTFTIVNNATWHDNTTLTAEDVKFSIEYYRDRDPQAGWMNDVISSVEVLDGNRVRLSLNRSYGNLLTEFMTYTAVPQHIWSGVENPLTYNGTDRIVGSGPFRLESWDPAAGKFVFIANANYFGGKPKVDRLEVYVFGTMDALVMALIRGDIDTWWDYSGEFPNTYIPPLLVSGKIDFAFATFLGVPAALGFNDQRSLTNNITFRRAVTYAINYSQIVDLVFGGYGTVPTYGFSPSTHPNHNNTIPRLACNRTMAENLLNSIGVIDSDSDGWREFEGAKVTLTLLTRSDSISMLRSTEMVASDLKAIGLDTNIVALGSAAWRTRKDAKNYDLVFFRGTPWGMLMHAGHGSGYFDSRRTGAGVLFNLNNAEYLATCDARLATAIPGEQAQLDNKLQQLHGELLPGIALAWIESTYPYRKGWENWVVDHIYGGVVNSFSWFTVTRGQ